MSSHSFADRYAMATGYPGKTPSPPPAKSSSVDCESMREMDGHVSGRGWGPTIGVVLTITVGTIFVSIKPNQAEIQPKTNRSKAIWHRRESILCRSPT